MFVDYKGVPRFKDRNLAKLYQLIRVIGTDTRYALRECYIAETGSVLVSTDGRQLIELIGWPSKLKIKSGQYHVTDEGFLAPVESILPFPGYREIIPTDCDVQYELKWPPYEEQLLNTLLLQIVRMGFNFNFDLCFKSFRQLVKVIWSYGSSLKLSCYKDKPEEALRIDVDCSNLSKEAKLLYLVMPITNIDGSFKEGEVKG